MTYHDLIPENVITIWYSSSIPFLVILSLSLQVFLVLLAPFRRKTGNQAFHSLIWSAYLLATWVPTFTTGLILKSVRASKGISGTSVSARRLDDDILALWAPTLLRCLGGSFTIKAFSLQDNELWTRHVAVFIIQLATVFYAFLFTLPNNKLLVPTIFSLLGGSISYGYRVFSMYSASLDKYREGIVTSRQVEGNTEKLLDVLSEQRKEPLGYFFKLDVAYHYFQIFKGLIVNLEYKPLEKKQKQIVEVFRDNISSEDAFQVMLHELHYMYQVFFTNEEAFWDLYGASCWCISMILGAVALGTFAHAGKQDFNHVDIRISYALFVVPLVLDLIICQGVHWVRKSSQPLIRQSHHKESKFFKPCNMLYHIVRFICERKPKEVQIEEGVHLHVNDTCIFFQEWSEAIFCHNLVSYCLGDSPPRTIPKPHGGCQACIAKILCFLCNACGACIARIRCLAQVAAGIPLSRCLDKLVIRGSALHKAIYVSRCPLTKELWDFIYDNLWEMTTKMENGEEEFVPDFLKDVEYDDIDEYLLLWHIATELCYNTEKHGSREGNATKERIFSKILSDYMLYLMVYQPGMMSEISGMFVANYKEACEQIAKFLGGDRQLKKACEKILDSKGEIGRKYGRESLLYRACDLAENLKKLEEAKRWRITCGAWVEMLTYAARHCRGDMHIQSLSMGGELLTLVWLLMAHFGLIRHKKWRSHISHKRIIVEWEYRQEEQGELQICEV
ncbi:hypothetical protein CDL15_Pgr010739 [Punica granatum]|uniref:DUF4220 domain-containing protein n=1 Tax=Punica granatum TaxID=22663 RepID=A0A218W6E1_PUNGR|nr:hypothetical protein CDL15_Pgr010739 [Punica granatum]